MTARAARMRTQFVPILAAACLLELGAPRPLPAQTALGVLRGERWVEWWSPARAPAQWTEPLPLLADAVAWQDAGSGIEWGELHLSGRGLTRRVLAIVVRADPGQLRFSLVQPADGRWTVDAAPPAAVLAFNAGQYTRDGPWGWIVREGRERQAPGAGPLAVAIASDSSGAMRWIDEPAGLSAVRAAGVAREAFQSYPVLLGGDGVVPEALRAGGTGVDLQHRDARLALGELRDGRLLVVLTRFDGLGGTLEAAPFGPAVPEMAALMGGLGCRRAVLLDGGISAQLLVRQEDGTARRWSGWRDVPLGMIAVRR